jgi:pimeloyl-ACP methyl ester carboxylesterase
VVLVGAEDELVPISEARAAAEALPRGLLRIVPGAGHLLPLEAPHVVNDVLDSLLVAYPEPAS